MCVCVDYINAGMRTTVDKLIAAELKRMPKPRDPSALFPDIELFKDNELMQQELDRVRRGKPMEPKLDLSRYQLELPSSLSSSLPSSSTAAAGAGAGEATEATAVSQTPSASEELPDGRVLWLKALDNANAQLEHQNQRILNLELVQKFGGNAWNIHNYQMEYDLSLLRKALDDKKAEVMELNKHRKRDQVKYRTHPGESFFFFFVFYSRVKNTYDLPMVPCCLSLPLTLITAVHLILLDLFSLVGTGHIMDNHGLVLK